jgi:regulator of sigma E protease
MEVKRPGIEGPIKFLVHPDFTRGFPTIGIASARITTLAKEPTPFFPGSAASRAKPTLQKGDRIVTADGVAVENYPQLNTYLAEHPDKPLQLTVECTVPEEGRKAGGAETSKLVGVSVLPQPMRTLGLVMTMGEIVAVQDGSPAAVAGIQTHDRVVKIDGKPVDDPMLLPDQLRRRGGETIVLTIDREGSPSPIDLSVMLRKADWYEQPQTENNPLSIPELGIAYRVLNRVERVIPGSPAEKAGIQAGEMIQKATILPPDLEPTEEKIAQSKITIAFDEKNTNWPFFFYTLQTVYPGSRVELGLNNNRSAILEAQDDPNWFNPNRGFIFEPEAYLKKAQSFGQAIYLGGEETWESLTLIVRVLRKLGSQISVKELSGPITIARVAANAAQQGIAKLLLFLTLLSANLAVLNILPIPILDGGHLLFLAYEGIRGKPADERVQIGLSVVGLFFLVGLMVFVTGMDIIRLIFK